MWGTRTFQSKDPQETHAANFEALGKYDAYSELIELDYERYIGVMTDDDSEFKRTSASGESGALQALSARAEQDISGDT